MKLAICGSRNIKIGAEAILDLMYSFHPKIYATYYEIVSGGAEGIDSAAEELADFLECKRTIIYPDYLKYPPKTAPLKRNAQIADYADELLLIWSGNEKSGSGNVKREFEKRGKKVHQIVITSGK